MGREKQPHWQWWTTGSDYDWWRWSINNLPRKSIIGYHTLSDGVGPIFERRIFPEVSTPLFHTRQQQKIGRYDDKASNRSQRGQTMTINTGGLGKAINNLWAFGATWDHLRQEYVSFIVVAALQDEILFKKVLHATITRLTKLMVCNSLALIQPQALTAVLHFR